MVLLLKLKWKAPDSEEEISGLSPLSDVFGVVARKGIDVKNNIMEFEVKNASGKYVDSDGNILFSEDDIFDLHVKETSDATDIGSSWDDSTNLIGTYYLKEFKQISTNNRHRIRVSSVDKAYVLFNRVTAQSFGFGSNEYWTSPGIFRSIVRTNSPKDSESLGYVGTDNVEGVRFDIDARFVSEGGNITDYRDSPATQLDGAITDSATTITVDSTSGFEDEGTLVINGEHIFYTDTTPTTFTGCVRGIDDTKAEAQDNNEDVYQGFPITKISKVWTPIYEWLAELGQPGNTNYLSEQTGTLEYDRSFLLWLDKDNRIYYVPTTDDVDTDLVIGDDQIYECSLEKALFDSVNMVIYNVGEDMYGAGLNWYWYDENTNTNDLKMRYQPYPQLIEELLLEQQKEFPGIYETTPANDEFRRFPTSGQYPISDWAFKFDSNEWRTKVNGESARTTLTSDSDYNDSLREAALWRGRVRAQNITSRVGGLRYRGTVTTRGSYYNPGDLITVTDSNTGLSVQKIRVVNVSQNISKNQWSTTLDVEEDEEALSS